MERLCYYFRLGLWDVVGGLQSSIENDSSCMELKSSLERLLWCIIIDSNSTCFPSPIVQTPWQQIWLATSLMCHAKTSMLGDTTVSSEVDTYRVGAEFQSVLQSMSPNAPPIVIQELCHLYNLVTRADQIKDNMQCFSLETHRFLSKGLMRDTISTNILIQHLLCLWCPQFIHTDNELQELYQEVLEKCIQELKVQHQHHDASVIEKCISGLDTLDQSDTTRRNIDILLLVLSLLEVSVEKELKLLDWFSTQILLLCEMGIIPKQLVYFALLSRSKLNLLRALSKTEDAKYTSHDETNPMLDISDRRLLNSKGDLHVEEMFQITINTGVHWIEYITNICSKLVMNTSCETKTLCVPHPFVKKILPLILLNSWCNFLDNDDMFDVLHHLLIECKKNKSDSMFLYMSAIMEQQMLLVTWCKTHGRIPALQSDEILQLAKENSTLETLRRTTNLAEVELDKVKEILHRSHTEGVTEEQPITPAANSETCPLYWDIITFDGFCILMTAFEIIQKAMEIEKLMGFQNPSNDIDCGDTEFLTMQKLYKEGITENLQEMQQNISQIFPLNFRVELLENIFSLLFLRHQHFKEDSTFGSDAEEEYDDDIGEKSSVVSTTSEATQMHSMSSDSSGRKLLNSLSSFSVFENVTVPQCVLETSSSSSILSVLEDELSRSEEFSGKFATGDTVPSNTLLLLPAVHPTKDHCTPASTSDTNDNVSLNGVACLPSLSETNNNTSSTYFTSSKECKYPNNSSNPSVFMTDIQLHPTVKSQENSENVNMKCKTNRTHSGISRNFLCSEILVRDMLHCLKECLVNTSAAFYSVHACNDEDSLQSDVLSSVPMNSLQQRMNRLSQCASEATWRLQLLTDTNFMKEIGRLPQQQHIVAVDSQVRWQYPSEDSGSESEDDKETDYVNAAECKKNSKSLKNNKSEAEKSSESGSQTTPTGSRLVTALGHHKSRQSRRSNTFPVSNCFITQMLSSQSSLAVQCLAKGEFDKAKGVIQMCGIEESPLAIDIKFTEGYQNLRQKLKICAEGSRKTIHASFDVPVSLKKTSTLQSIKQVATAGVYATSLTSEVERFLSVTALPSIQEIKEVMADFPQTANMIQSADYGIALATVDLALTVGTTYEHSVSLLDLVCKHCPVLQGNTNFETGNKQIVGYIQFIQNLIQILNLRNVECHDKMSSSLLSLKISLCDLVSFIHSPLSLKALKDYVYFWNTLFSSVKNFQESMNNNGTVMPCDSQERPTSSRSKEYYNMKEHSEFRNLMKICSATPVTKDILRSPTKTDDASKHGVHYLERLYTYLKLLSTHLVHNLSSKQGFSSHATFFNILDESIVSLFGRLVFECDVPPKQLEPVAHMIRHNLVYSVVHNCCPSISDRILREEINSLEHYKLISSWGKVILNQSPEPWSGSVKHPEVVVRSLLSELLGVLREYRDDEDLSSCSVLNQKQARNLVNHPNVQSVLAETQILASVDITLLTPGDEMLVFFINLTNLLWIHSLLLLETSLRNGEKRTNGDVKISDKILNMKTSFGLLSACPLERYISLKCVGYNVGQLGFLSLYTLHQVLLGKELSFPYEPSLKSVISIEDSESEKSALSGLNLSVDPRTLFALVNGHNQSPKVQVLIVENLDTQLDKAMTEFLQHNVRLNEHGQLCIPHLLQWYQEVVYLNQEPESSATLPALARSPNHFSSDENSSESNIRSKEKLALLLDFLRDNAGDPLQSHLIDITKSNSDVQSLIGSEFVKIENIVYEFSIKLNYPLEQQRFVHLNPSGSTSGISEALWKQRKIQEPVLKFLECHCWLLSVLVHKIHHNKVPNDSCTTDEISSQQLDDRTKYLDQLFFADWVTVLKPIFQENSVITSLHLKPENEILWNWLSKVLQDRQWKICLEVLQALPETLHHLDPKLQALNDLVLFELASKLPDKDCPNPWRFCQHIGDVSKQAECVLKNLPLWPGSGCNEALKTVIEDHHRKLPNETRLQLQQSLHKIQIYDQILSCCQNADIKCWYDVSCTSETNPGLILKKLIHAKEFQLCLQWAYLHGIHSRSQQLIDSKFLLLLLDPEPSDFTAAKQLLLSLSPHQSIKICGDVLQHLRSISCLKFNINFMLDSYSTTLSPGELTHYRLLAVGIQMLAVIPVVDQTQFWDLIGQPQLIVEQLIMNTRLKLLETVLEALHPTLSQLPINSPVSVNSIDMMLRQYAYKALDFRVRQTQASCWIHPTDENLMDSLSMASSYSEEFVMPEKVPAKTEWVPNDEVAQCMCCRSVTFSMFNRRHHCRRCGRVICGSCSTKRMKVLGYGDVSVRVCDGCYEQTYCLPSSTGDQITKQNHLEPSLGSTSSTTPNLWKLTLDESHNTTVREEFGYEHAPSVSLCLAVLQLHSEQTAYPRFLLDSCDQMLHILQPVGPGTVNPEVDHSLVIRMVRSLVVAAKVKYARYGLNTGVVHCDQLLSQVDLLSMLVKSGCSALIPAESLNGHALRRLRDCLVEEEMWSVAMEVSTKSGLDRAGVWAAWGKACLQAGCWDEAREKFSHCLERVTSGSDSLRPLRNPPLLNEIVQILETGAYIVDRKVLQQADKIRASKDTTAIIGISSPALSILHTLASLKGISQGKYTQATPPSNTVIIGPKLDPLFYDECCYYLTTYGSHAGIISFYLSHDDLPAALQHVISQKVDQDIFLETVYLSCLFQGLTSTLYHELTLIDPSLETWKSYLCHVCHHLERQNLLNVLYQLQLYMQDYIRAAMTCIRFYQSGARNYCDLSKNIGYLNLAQKHLETELESVHWGATSKSLTASSGENILNSSQLAMKLEPREVDRHINTILRQIEVTKFLHTCEQQQKPVLELISELFQQWTDSEVTVVPTLFGNNYERVQLAVLAILCGKNVEEGFGIAFRIIQDYHLKALRVFSLAGKKLASDSRLSDIEQLIGCIQSSGMSDTNSIRDEVLALCVRVLAAKSDPGDIEPLVKLMLDIGSKISAYIECRQLKSAYLLAVKYDRLGDVRRILREAERLGQSAIRKICLKRLNQYSSS